jgi:hypothetical protein
MVMSLVFQSARLGPEGECSLDSVIVKLANDKRRDHRAEVANAGVHAPNTAGIWAGKYGARSIVMSGGYDDDVDNGDSMCAADICFLVRFSSLCHRTYTGTGGYGDDNRYGGNNSSGSAVQSDQSFDHRDNHALRVRSHGLADDAYLPFYSFPRSR